MLHFPLPTPTTFNLSDTAIIFFLSLFSFATHLWLLPFPDCVVFDEVHFGSFTNGYITSSYFFDIHPPLGKLIMFLISNFSQYDGSINFDRPYGQSHSTSDYFILRIAPATFSSMCCPLTYLTMRFATFSHSTSFLSAFLIACDTSFLTEHRFTLSDGLLHFFVSLYICFHAYTASLPEHERTFFTSILINGILLGCACSCKNTAWGLMPYTAFCEFFLSCQFFDSFQWPFWDDLLCRGFLILGSVILIHLISFGIHISLLPFHAQGDQYLPNFLRKQLLYSQVFETQLRGHRGTIPTMYFRIIILAATMHVGNMGIRQFHPYMSRPINWPLLTGNFVAFWWGVDREINCMGNVFVYYPAFFGICAIVMGWKREKWNIAIRWVVGWIWSFFPFFVIPRSMYLYHYLIPLMFGCMAAGAAIEIWFSLVGKGIAVVVISMAAAFGFWLWSPLSYGTKHLEETVIIWTENWRHGDAFHRALARGNKG
jgi:dolichyl-phosphate-mannose--protein O-mannosyl transferase